MQLSAGDRIRLKYLSQHLPKGKGKLLDTGSGRNIYKNLVEEKGYTWYGIDIAPIFPAIYGDITNIPFPDNYFDKAVSIDVIEEVENDELAIKELHRVLKPNGMLILHTPNSAQSHILAEFPDNPYHVRRGYKKDELKKLLSIFTKVVIRPTFTITEAIFWELYQGKPVDLNRLIEFNPKQYKNLAWIAKCKKVLP
jgi:SAM-dependent methyltransferase